MKKSLIFVGLLAIGFANAQEYDGKVGINTNEPKATLDITLEASNLTGTTNEGIIAPRLTKTRIANIEASKLTEGTLVYATDAVYTAGADTAKNNRVAKINEKGYYFYNGTEWVKVQYKDTDTNDAEWVYDDSTKRINLKRSGSGLFTPNTYYAENGGYTRVGVDKFKLWNYSSKSEIERQGAATGTNYNYSIMNSKLIPSTGSRYITLHSDHLLLNEAGTVNQYVSRQSSSTILTADNTRNHGDITGISEAINLHGTGNVVRSTAIEGITRIGRATMSGEATGVLGFTIINSDKNIYGVQGLKSDLSFEENTAKITEASGVMVRLNIEDKSNATINNLVGTVIRPVVSTDNKIKGTNTITNFAAFKHEGFVPNTTTTLQNNYGLYIGNVSGASQINRAIHTETGKIRFGDLADSSVADGVNRQVIVDKDGVLKVGTATASTGATTLTGEEDLECNATNRGKMNFVKNDAGFDVFGICMKGTNGYSWRYIYGNAGVSNGSGNFGTGLQ